MAPSDSARQSARPSLCASGYYLLQRPVEHALNEFGGALVLVYVLGATTYDGFDAEQADLLREARNEHDLYFLYSSYLLSLNLSHGLANTLFE